jgi:uncharacterized membrane protein
MPRSGYCDQCGTGISIKLRLCASCGPEAANDELERDALRDRTIESGRVWVQQSFGTERKQFNKAVLGWVIVAAAFGGILVFPTLEFLATLIGGLTATSDWVISPMAYPLCLITVLTTWYICYLHFKKFMEVRLQEINRMKSNSVMVYYDLLKHGIDPDTLLAQE